MRLIDADSMKELWQGCEIKGSIAPLLDVRPTINAIPIPDNATNGYVLKAVFPDVKWFVNEDGEVFTDHKTLNQQFVKFSIDWWNAPYKKGE